MLKLPLRSGPYIDWRPGCLPGDSQGETDACTVFALANWAECMLGKPITDAYAIDVWRAERMFRHGNINGGLQITEAFAAVAIRTNWLPRGTTIRRVSNLSPLPLAPLVVAMSGLEWSIPPGTSLLSKVNTGTNHAVLAVADMDAHVWIENSHGPRWGADGFGRMTHATFARHCTQVWQIILPQGSGTVSAPLKTQTRRSI